MGAQAAGLASSLGHWASEVQRLVCARPGLSPAQCDLHDRKGSPQTALSRRVDLGWGQHPSPRILAWGRSRPAHMGALLQSV